ncbi:class I SAM-dependent methyltransferase [Streptomyces aurantiacus]|uniref:class I SAM-dependent methyltransferase n=1 Tax=Streptomyces aurantiacus TaxID=47760 RepID=UPI00131A3738|nr:class I SAM-dependent methyltransferase [Streptomyces aurantiacus]
MPLPDDFSPRLIRGDAFGQLLSTCWAAGGAPGAAVDAAERDDGFLFQLDASLYFQKPDEWCPTDRWACERAVGDVLDVGCGAGRHALVLQEAGHRVLGVDPSPGAVSVARQRGVDVKQLAVPLPAHRLGVFDTVAMLGGNLALLGSDETAKQVLESLTSVTHEGSRIVGTGMDPHLADMGTDGAAYLEDNRRGGRLPGQFQMRVRHGAAASEWFEYLMASEQELVGVLRGTPWRLSEISPYEESRYGVVLVRS